MRTLALAAALACLSGAATAQSLLLNAMHFNGKFAAPIDTKFCITPDTAPGAAGQQVLLHWVLVHGTEVSPGGPAYVSFWQPAADLVQAAIDEAKKRNLTIGCGGAGETADEKVLWWQPGDNGQPVLLWKSCAVAGEKPAVSTTKAGRLLAALFNEWPSCGGGVP